MVFPVQVYLQLFCILSNSTSPALFSHPPDSGTLGDETLLEQSPSSLDLQQLSFLTLSDVEHLTEGFGSDLIFATATF